VKFHCAVTVKRYPQSGVGNDHISEIADPYFPFSYETHIMTFTDGSYNYKGFWLNFWNLRVNMG